MATNETAEPVAPIGNRRLYFNLVPILFKIKSLLKGCRSLCDVGCGDASPVRLFGFEGEKVGVDGFEGSLTASRAAGIHDRYILSDIRSISAPDKAFDAVISMDVIEHLPKEQGDAFLRELERIASKLVIVTTPNGFVPQGAYGGNEFQRHLSGWTPAELRERGYKTRGFYGLKNLRGEYANIVGKPTPLWWMLSKLSEPLVYRRPSAAFAFLAYKRLDRGRD